jgi:hypothetical protein
LLPSLCQKFVIGAISGITLAIPPF